MASTQIKRLPYGVADFAKVQRDQRYYYVDKTHFIPFIEEAGDYLFLVRPRRFGKSLWLSILQYYYDLNKRDEFETLFGGTYIGGHPTDERNSYLILMFNFAMVNPTVSEVSDSFENNGKAIVSDFLLRYQQFFDEQERQDIRSEEKTEYQLRSLFFHAARKQLRIYLLIDEYDNFANTILTTAGEQAYRDLTHGGGFFRYFFNLLKGATSGQSVGIARLFITGVSPITMDDVTSGFNIGENISLHAKYQELLGFTEDEVIAMIRYYEELGLVQQGSETCLDLMKVWYNGYRFSKQSDTEVFNPDMVLYFLKQVTQQQIFPDDMIDHNIRIDYGKLRHLLLVNRQLNGNFRLLEEVIETGELNVSIQLSFPVERLLHRENFASLLFYFGLLSIKAVRRHEVLLHIPNQTVKRLMYGYLRDAFEDVDLFRIDLWHFSNLLRSMAYEGAWQPVMDFLAEQIAHQTAIRDYLGGEKVIQGFLLAYLSVTQHYLTWSERELGKGFADIYLEPSLTRFPDMPFGYLIELKYLPRSEFSDDALQKTIAAAAEQLQRYAGDTRLREMAQRVTLKRLILVYNGWELVYREECPD